MKRRYQPTRLNVVAPPDGHVQLVLAIIHQAQLDVNGNARDCSKYHFKTAKLFFTNGAYQYWMDLVASYLPDLELKNNECWPLPAGVEL